MTKEYYDSYARFNGGDGNDLIVTDKEVADYTIQHMHPEDQADIRRVVECALASFTILSGSAEAPDEPWFYYDDLEKKG